MAGLRENAREWAEGRQVDNIQKQGQVAYLHEESAEPATLCIVMRAPVACQSFED